MLASNCHQFLSIQVPYLIIVTLISYKQYYFHFKNRISIKCISSDDYIVFSFECNKGIHIFKNILNQKKQNNYGLIIVQNSYLILQRIGRDTFQMPRKSRFDAKRLNMLLQYNKTKSIYKVPKQNRNENPKCLDRNMTKNGNKDIQNIIVFTQKNSIQNIKQNSLKDGEFRIYKDDYMFEGLQNFHELNMLSMPNEQDDSNSEEIRYDVKRGVKDLFFVLKQKRVQRKLSQSIAPQDPHNECLIR